MTIDLARVGWIVPAFLGEGENPMVPTNPIESAWSGEGIPDLLRQAAAVLDREGARLPITVPGSANLPPAAPAIPGMDSLKLPMPAAGSGFDPDRLRRYAS